MQILEAKLNDLKLDPANVRQTDRAPDEGLLASIRAKGLIVPLTVRKNGAGYFVIDGGKRLAALHILARDGDFDKTKPIACVLRDDDAAAAADTSLTANFIREDMHAVDIYEAFGSLRTGGKSTEDIAKEYALPIPTVRQYLALGALSPKVREAWRTGEFGDDDDGDPQEIAEIFTLAGDHAAQDIVFEKLKKQKRLKLEWQVREAIVGNSNEGGKLVAFVGTDAYKAAGGGLREDLFGDDHVIEDLPIAKKLADDKLLAECQKAIGLGWSWAEPLSALPKGCEHSWQRAYDSLEQFPKTKRKDWGLAFYIDREGRLDEYIMQKPEQKKAADKASKTKAAKKAEASGEPKEVAISAALCGRISQQITTAAEQVLALDDHLGLAVLVAAMTSSDGPACIKHYRADDDGEFANQLALARKKPASQLFRILTGLAASSLDLGGHVQHVLPLAVGRDEDRALLEALDPKKLNAELRASFDAADYFAGVTAQACKDAIALCDPKQPITGKEKKSDLAKLAAELVKKSNAGGKAGYLPPEMRTAHYDGPASKAAKPAAKTKTAKKKGR
jgi:ParB family chromosome partitioning protein